MANIAVFLCLAAFASTVSGTIMPYTINCSEQEICLRDLQEWCLVGEQEPVFGHCELQQRVCNGAQIDFSNHCLLPYPIKCEEPRTCVPDLQAWCLKGVPERVFGHCAIQRAICDNGAQVDFSNSCFLPYPINCAEPRTCVPDLQAHCLEGVAEPVFGHCSIQNAICDNGAVYDPSERCLNHSTSSLIR